MYTVVACPNFDFKRLYNEKFYMNSLPQFATTRRFAPLFLTQFLGAFNDNLFKTTLFVLISFYGLGKNDWIPSSQMLNFGALLFVLPYFLFSALSGQLASRYNKAKIARLTKALEIGIMLLAGWGFYIQSALLLLLCLFMMGVHSTLFGPVKYAILPEYLHEKELLMGNGLIESGTFISILLGQMIGTAIAGYSVWVLIGTVLLVAMLGFASSTLMPNVAPKEPNLQIDKNVIRSTKLLCKETFQQKELFTAIIGISWFWFAGAVYTTQLPTFVQIHLGGNQNVFNLMLALFSIGIALGSVLCARLSRGELRLGLVVLGNVGLMISGCLLVWFCYGRQFHHTELQGIFSFLGNGFAYPMMILMWLIGFFGGFFSVPLYTWLQTASNDDFRAHAIAANNIVNAVFMVSSAIIGMILLMIFDNILVLYLLVALGNVGVMVYLFKRSPVFITDIRQWVKK